MRSCRSITVKTVTLFRCNDNLVISVKILTTLVWDLNSTQGKQEMRRKTSCKIKAGKIILRERLPEKPKLITVPAHSFASAEWHSRRLICIADLHIWVFAEPGHLQKSHNRSLSADLTRLWVGCWVGRGEWGGGSFCSLIWNLWTVISQSGFLWKTVVLEWHSSEESLCLFPHVSTSRWALKDVLYGQIACFVDTDFFLGVWESLSCLTSSCWVTHCGAKLGGFKNVSGPLSSSQD